MTALAPTLETFLTERLMIQRGASPNTVASYRDTFRLLLRFAADRKGKRPCDLDFADLDAALIVAFLEHLEVARGNSVCTRNNRLSAIHSLFAYAALRHPEHAGMIQRVLAIPVKLHDRKLVTYLTDDEVEALIGACDVGTRTGRRDQTLLDVAVETGLRISELAALRCSDVTLGTGANLHVTGKGPQGAVRPPRPRDRQSAARLATRNRRRRRRPTIPNNHRPPHEPRRDRAPRHAPRQTSRHEMPFAAAQGSHHPLAPAQLRRAAPSERGSD